MALVFKVNSRDLSSYLRVGHGDGLDPAPGEYLEPQYAGSAAMGEGQFFVGDAVNNSTKVFPLILKAATTDALYQLIRDIRADLVKGNQVEYRSGGASTSTFFDLEGGVLDPDFEFWLDQGKRCRATLTIQTRPYGHTGTTRLLASSVVTGMGNILASGLSGDVDAQAVLKFGTGSSSVLSQYMFAYGVKSPVPSGWVPEWRAASMAGIPTQWNGGYLAAGVALRGASGQLASQAVGFGLGATGNYGQATTFFALSETRLPPVTYAGRHRAFISYRYGLFNSGPSGFSGRPKIALIHDPIGGFQDLTSASMLSSADFKLLGMATANSPMYDFQLADMGEISIPTAAASARSTLHVLYGGASGWMPASAGASYPLEIGGLFLLPVDRAAGVFFPGSKLGYAGNAATRALELNAVNKTSIYSNGLTVNVPQFFKGEFPTIPVPSGGARIVTLQGRITGATLDSWKHSDQTTVSIEVRERFTYLR